MYVATQFSIPLVNKVDALAHVLGELDGSGANLSAMMVTVPLDRSSLRVVFDEPEEARQTLSKMGLHYGETKVICVNLAGGPGTLAGEVKTLAEARVEVKYAYFAAGKKPGQTVAVLRVSDVERAMSTLHKARRVAAEAPAA